jgi:hypothetical protein
MITQQFIYILAKTTDTVHPHWTGWSPLQTKLQVVDQLVISNHKCESVNYFSGCDIDTWKTIRNSVILSDSKGF